MKDKACKGKKKIVKYALEKRQQYSTDDLHNAIFVSRILGKPLNSCVLCSHTPN